MIIPLSKIFSSKCHSWLRSEPTESFSFEYYPPIFQPSEGVYLLNVLLSFSNFYNIQERQRHGFAEQAFLNCGKITIIFIIIIFTCLAQ